jgi:hypothetical protein
VDRPLSDDTSPEMEQRQIERWRAMTPAQKLAIAMDMSETVRQLALIGIRQRYPAAPPREQFLRLAILTLGADLAARVYPEIADLDTSS